MDRNTILKGTALSQTLNKMFKEQDEMEQMTAFLKEKGFFKIEMDSKEIPKDDSKFTHKIRRIRSSTKEPEMKERILTQTGNRKKTFISDTGTSTPIKPKAVATRNRMKWLELDTDEPGCKGVTGDELSIIGQCPFFVKFDILKKANKVRALVCSDEGSEILIDLHSLIDWTILPHNFPCPLDPREAEKSSVRKTKEKN